MSLSTPSTSSSNAYHALSKS